MKTMTDEEAATLQYRQSRQVFWLFYTSRVDYSLLKVYTTPV